MKSTYIFVCALVIIIVTFFLTVSSQRASAIDGLLTSVVIISSTSAMDSTNKTATSTCSSDYTLMGGGVRMTTAPNVLIQVTQSYPDIVNNAWVATMQESASVTGNWQFRVFSICGRFI